MKYKPAINDIVFVHYQHPAYPTVFVGKIVMICSCGIGNDYEDLKYTIEMTGERHQWSYHDILPFIPNLVGKSWQGIASAIGLAE